MANCNRTRPLANIEWNFANLLLVAHAREALSHSISNRTFPGWCSVPRRRRSQTRAKPYAIHCSMELCNFAANRTRARPLADVQRYSAVSLRTRDRLLAMFNGTLQLCRQSHAREALGRCSIELCNPVACVLWAGWQSRSPALEEGGM
jgi:hypothetical protein